MDGLSFAYNDDSFWRGDIFGQFVAKQSPAEDQNKNNNIGNKEDSPSDRNEKKAIFEKRYQDGSRKNTDQNFHESIERKVFFELVQSKEIKNA